MALLVAVMTAWLTMQSLQIGCTAALLILAVGLYVRDRTAGLVAVWIVWLVVPMLRRMFLLGDPIQKADPLALAPFLLTAAVVVLEFTQVDLSRRIRRLLLLAAGGYALGLPLGLLIFPRAAAFAFFAYLTALGCFVIGYREAEHRRLVLPTVLMIATPFLALYAFPQYYLPLPKWDFIWQRTAEFNTIGSPEHGRIRVWSTLNSPGTFALVLGVSGLTLLMWRRLTPLKGLAALAVTGALALTYVRSAWVAIVVTLVVTALVTRGAALKRVIPIAALIIFLGPLVFGGSTGAALTDRFNTLSFLGNDTSAQARSGTSRGLVPLAVGNPLGTGLGSAGEPSRLNNSDTGLRATDNGYLSLLAQVGPVGFLVVISVFFSGVVAAVRNAIGRGSAPTDVLTFAIAVYFVVSMLAGDDLYGIGGMIFWYTAGLAMRRREIKQMEAVA